MLDTKRLNDFHRIWQTSDSGHRVICVVIVYGLWIIVARNAKVR